MLHINVASLRFGDGLAEPSLPDISLYITTDAISLRDLIARSVEEQIAKLLDEHQKTASQTLALLERQYFDNDELAKQATSGKIAMPSNRVADAANGKIETAREIKRATQAFQAGKYKIFVNGREYVELDETISLTEGMKINFIRLMPLVGG